MEWLGTGFWHGPTVIGGYESRPEREQAVFRSTLGSAVFLIYLGYAVGNMDEKTRVTLLMIALYVAFGLATWVAVSLHPSLSTTRLTITTIIDQGMAAVALALGGRAALPLLFIVFWFLVGTGCRYGKRPLILSCSIAFIGFACLMIWQPWWVANRQVGVGLLLSVVATSFYLYVLVNKLERRAATDPLTGLLNRSSFEHLVERTQSNLQNGEQTAVLLIDLDGFKNVNDSLGHRAGDTLLQSFASKLPGACRRGDVIARLGGDEFAVFARNLCGLDELHAVANRIHQATDCIGPTDWSLDVSASIGICPVPGSTGATRHRVPVSAMLHSADRAMYQAKANGGAQTVFSYET
ncbi:diguanylate cyclase (GGDEF)-like protein [Paraburkholderia sp. BL6665CI2N2]|uniref:GGDEF domain-containing protein n=1 Tax=Paraburkholderia sp. BL6665CI2N2 TaxID=1938806 RepID=UPI001065B086|nr:GGDEF domain-containing protein [Paraburkholderia sp. BL6665CI2N2]TDY22036.1 diguanylate cyclase (GGDEF)-like protein [Paraburkholderia sp. BL6665CI2N2]